MKYTTLIGAALATVLCATVAYSQDVLEYTKRVVCSEPKVVFKVLQEEYGEVIILSGEVQGGKTAIAITTNPKNGNWSVVEFNERQACVINSGTKGRVYLDNLLKNGKSV